MTAKTEWHINRKPRSPALTSEEFGYFLPALRARPHLLVWEGDRRERASGGDS